jgi:hypothetical protein
VRRIFALRQQDGLTLALIATTLNAEGERGAKGAPWTAVTVLRVLRAEPASRGGKRGASDVCWPRILDGGEGVLPTDSPARGDPAHALEGRLT